MQRFNPMAFLNEYIPEADFQRYELPRVCGEHNRVHRGHMLSRDWTIDRERNAFLVKVWTHRDSEFSGWAFYWHGEWMFFEMAVRDARDDPTTSSCWSLYQIRGFVVPKTLDRQGDEVLEDLRSGFGAHAGGGVFVQRAHRSATLEFV